MRTLDQMLAALPIAERIRLEAAYWGMVLDAHTAQGIEAASAAKTATEIGGLVHESPVAESDAPNSNGPSPEGFVR